MYFDYKRGDFTVQKIQAFSQILGFGTQKLVMTTLRDMSDWAELEQQKNLSYLKTVAFASAAHEFRNPLNAIVSSLSLLENLFDKTKGHKYYTTAKNCSNLMLFLI